MRITPVPETPQEAVRAFGAGIGPRGGLIGGTGKHHEGAGRIGAELLDDVARFHDVVLTLTHLLDAAGDNGQAVVFGRHLARTPLFVVFDVDFIGVVPALVTVGKLTVEAFGGKHALGKEALKGFVILNEPQIAHHLGPEARVQQVQHRVLNAADVLIHRRPVVVAFIDHGLVGVRRAVAHVVPGAVDERIHRVGFTLGIRAALRALDVEKRFALIQRIARAVRNQVFRQNHRQILFRHRNRAAVRAVDDGNGRTPVALTGNTPVAQTELCLLVAEPHRFQIRGNRVDRFMNVKPVVLAGVDAVRVKRLVAVPVLPGIRREFLTFNGADLNDRNAELLCERKVAFVVCGHAHDGALAVAHENVVADPDFNLAAV